ncbi:MAG TPA: TIGR02996 domain-containing protein [Gemmataceae bacterium]|nr:TIGR02996 domain-containing protein [Gemmataceae bacterium]
MSDAFLKTIRENPDDDAPRLVYADWLDENGQPDRAEFIRLQIENAKRDRDAPERNTLEERALTLLQANFLDWIAQYKPLFDKPNDLTIRRQRWEYENGLIVEGVNRAQVEFRRGFVDHVTARPAALFAHGYSCFQPIGPAPTLRVSSHNYEGPCLDDYVTTLARSPLLEYVGAVCICDGFSNTTNRGIDLLTREKELLRKLKGLHLSELSGVSDVSMLPLLEASEITGFKYMDIGCTGCSFECVRMICDNPRFSHMETLNLDWLVSGKRNVRRFATSKNWVHLRVLQMNGSGLHDGTVAQLCRPGVFPRLELLGLSHNRLTPEGVRCLLSSESFPRLKILGLGGNPMTIDQINGLRSEFPGRVRIHFPARGDSKGFGSVSA